MHLIGSLALHITQLLKYTSLRFDLGLNKYPLFGTYCLPFWVFYFRHRTIGNSTINGAIKRLLILLYYWFIYSKRVLYIAQILLLFTASLVLFYGWKIPGSLPFLTCIHRTFSHILRACFAAT